jgi:ribosomal protein S25
VFEVLYWNNIRTFAWLSDQDKGGRKEETAGEKATNNAIYEQMPHKIRSGKGGDFAGIAQKFGISESYFRNLISKLKKRGLVEKVGKDYIKTPQGAPSIVDKETGEVFDLNTNVLADIEKAFG